MSRIVVIAVALMLAGCGTSRPFSKRDVQGAQKVAGLDFTKEELRTMRRNLERNLRSFEELREHPLDNSVAPVLWFEPRPMGFQMPAGEDRVILGLPESVDLPADGEFAFLSVAELGALLRDRKVTSVQLTEYFLARLARHDPVLKAVVNLTTERAMAKARTADAEISAGNWRGPLHGVPYGTKDLLAVPGYPTTWGAGPYQKQIIDRTAAVIQRLDASGAVLLAKLVSGELASGDRWFGGRTVTPWDTTTGASGSSAGPGSATAAGLVPFAIGTETWGSIISPSTRNGLTGLRPTYGLVSRAGTMTLSWSLDKIGPMCRSALDCAIVFDAIRGTDPEDPSTVAVPFRVGSERDWSSIRVGYLKAALDSDTTDTGNNARAALEIFRDMGVQVDSAALPGPVSWSGVISTIIRGESGAVFDELLQENLDEELSWQSSGSRANSLRQSRFIPAAEYIQANRHRALLIARMDTLMQEFDLLLTPSGADGSVTNLTGHPVITMKSGYRSPDDRPEVRLPTGVALVGRLYDEGLLLDAALEFQRRTQFHLEHPPQFGGETRH
ncbi:MAG: Asp-tRNA(Asn)/Glu-tRNA(Gln) amidotransferase A subunit family amidase [Rhodothermales bacterium]|jgi:Asp-tRNA(Asn)/Glu-tRNA(Gln) amidotransferase A subunit family amidase